MRRSYDAGREDRLSKPWGAASRAGDVPELDEIASVRERAWDLHRNNPYMRKAVSTVLGQILGCGLDPSPTAQLPDGDPHYEFRKPTLDLWRLWTPRCSALGLPGYGGVTWDTVAEQALREWLLSGEIFLRFRYMSPETMKRENRVVPFAVELLEAERLAEDTDLAKPVGNRGDSYIWRGIEYQRREGLFDRRVAYHFYDYHPADPRPIDNNTLTRRIPANEILHLYVADRPGQQRGVSPAASVVFWLRDIKDYQENELVASAVAACVAMAIKRTGGAPGFNGLNTPSGGDSADKDGNRYTRMQPGMVMNLNPGEDIEGFNPNRNNSDVVNFVTHLLRGVAAGLPGVKASSLTGDYKGLSYTSEKAADNDCWRVVERMQEWFVECLHQPVFERLIEDAVANGYYAERGLDMTLIDFKTNRHRYVTAKWNGPVPKSVNPGVDIKAAQLAIEAGLSSHEVEAAAQGMTTDELIEQEVEYLHKREPLDKLQLANAKKQAEVQAIAKPQPLAGQPKPAGKPKGPTSNGGKEGNIGQNKSKGRDAAELTDFPEH